MASERRCPYCGTTYEIPEVYEHINEYRTADPPPPAEVVIQYDDDVVHECRSGKRV